MRKRALVGALGALALTAGSSSPRAGAEAVTGICPDGSIYIVQHAAQIPCRNSKQVEPHEVPPMRPQYLPTPYTWKVWQQAQDPNNPYNLIDAARQVEELGARSAASDAAPEGGALPQVSAAPPGLPAPSLPSAPLDLGLDEEELRQLFLIVELSQEHTPASFARNTADGRGVLRLALARSGAFEEQLREAWASRGGLGGSGVLVFTARAQRPADFHANFTFVQGHLSYQPDPANPRQIGVLQGRLGRLEGDEVVLGYVVLPESIDPAADVDIYWNDRLTTARF